MELDATCQKGEKAQNDLKSSAELWTSEKQAKAEELAERLNESGDPNLLEKPGKLEGELITRKQNALQQRRQTWPQPQHTSEILSVSRSLKSSRGMKWKNVTKAVAHDTAYYWAPCGAFLDSSMINKLFKMATFDPNGGGEGSSDSGINSSEGQKGSSLTGTQEGSSKGRRPGKSPWKQWCCFGYQNEDDR
ncbi:hypothetical protein CDL15_Pgr007344 [Punica granatum]|uniref:Uncharacterized protein n=1 Tax=Punica granatum TaxID=22663 RepID=A0A218X9F3_PUNGR|nr:hypothetical protein CDL15_Pgr007344 [Punica granatum]PKI67748.1 hypothetical protein CRG98_011961 [Punica granatum]